MSIKVFCIGDLHFKADNEIETTALLSQLKVKIAEEQPDIVVVLGDTLHSHEKINLHILKRAGQFLIEIKSISPMLYILIGNHDRANNNVYMTDDHPFITLKEWGPTVKVVDTTCVAEHNGFKFIFVPYVPTGRFKEAIATIDQHSPYEGITCIFAHQEFMGAKMNAITSNEGDKYDLKCPLCISGHIHDYDQLQPNLIYTGTPIQHTYSDQGNKTVSLITFSRESNDSDTSPTIFEHKRIGFDIQKKLMFKMSPEELLRFEVPDNSRVKIKVMGEATVINEVMKTAHVLHLLRCGIKIEECPVSKVIQASLPTQFKTKIPFQIRLSDIIRSEQSNIQHTFYNLFPQFR